LYNIKIAANFVGGKSEGYDRTKGGGNLIAAYYSFEMGKKTEACLMMTCFCFLWCG
jgi:hypothetical protein